MLSSHMDALPSIVNRYCVAPDVPGVCRAALFPQSFNDYQGDDSFAESFLARYYNEVQHVQHEPTLLQMQVSLLALNFFGPMLAVVFFTSPTVVKFLLGFLSRTMKTTVFLIKLALKLVLVSSLVLVILTVSLARSADGEALLHLLYTGKGVFSPTETLLEGVTFVRNSSGFMYYAEVLGDALLQVLVRRYGERAAGSLIQEHMTQVLLAYCGATVNLMAPFWLPVVDYCQPRISTFQLFLMWLEEPKHRHAILFAFVIIGFLLAAAWGLIRLCCAVIVRMMRHAATKAEADATVEDVDDPRARAEDRPVILANREFVDETTEDENTAVSTSRTIKDFILCVQKHTAQLLPAACGAAVNLFAEYLIPVVAYGQPRISTFKLLLRKVMSFPFVVIGSLLAASWGLIRHCCAVIVRMMRHAATKAVADAMVENVDDTLARAEDMAVVLANAETIKNVEFMLPTSEYENTIVSTSRKIGGFIGRIPRWTSNSRLVISESVKLLLRNGQPEHPYRWMLHLAMKYRSAATESFLELPTTMAPAHRSGTEVAEVAPPQNIDDALAHAEDMAVVLANAETIKNVESVPPRSEYENTIISTSRRIGGFIDHVPRWTSNCRLVISESMKLLLRNGRPEHPYRWMLPLAMKYHLHRAVTTHAIEIARSGTEVAEVAPPDCPASDTSIDASSESSTTQIVECASVLPDPEESEVEHEYALSSDTAADNTDVQATAFSSDNGHAQESSVDTVFDHSPAIDCESLDAVADSADDQPIVTSTGDMDDTAFTDKHPAAIEPKHEDAFLEVQVDACASGGTISPAEVPAQDLSVVEMDCFDSEPATYIFADEAVTPATAPIVENLPTTEHTDSMAGGAVTLATNPNQPLAIPGTTEVCDPFHEAISQQLVVTTQEGELSLFDDAEVSEPAVLLPALGTDLRVTTATTYNEPSWASTIIELSTTTSAEAPVAGGEDVLVRLPSTRFSLPDVSLWLIDDVEDSPVDLTDDVDDEEYEGFLDEGYKWVQTTLPGESEWDRRLRKLEWLRENDLLQPSEIPVIDPLPEEEDFHFKESDMDDAFDLDIGIFAREAVTSDPIECGPFDLPGYTRPHTLTERQQQTFNAGTPYDWYLNELPEDLVPSSESAIKPSTFVTIGHYSHNRKSTRKRATRPRGGGGGGGGGEASGSQATF